MLDLIEIAYFSGYLHDLRNIFFEVVIGSHNDGILQQLVVILTLINNLIGSQYDYQLNYYLQSVSIFNSKPIFLDLITSAQQLGSQRGVKMEVPRD